MLLTLICLGFNTYLLFASGVSFFNVLLFTAAVVATYGLYVLGSAMFLDLAHIISSLPGYMIMLPTYINMMLPFALSNVHDISWGTRPQEPETARVLPKKNFANGAVTMDSSAHPSNNEIVVDVSLLTQAIQKGSKGEQRALAKKSISVEDQVISMGQG